MAVLKCKMCGGTNVDILLKQGFMSLKDETFDEAKSILMIL